MNEYIIIVDFKCIDSCLVYFLSASDLRDIPIKSLIHSARADFDPIRLWSDSVFLLSSDYFWFQTLIHRVLTWNLWLEGAASNLADDVDGSKSVFVDSVINVW